MQTRERSDVTTTLAICALLTQDTRSVQACAEALMDNCSLALQKSVLAPLAQSDSALELVLTTYAFAQTEFRLGFVWRGNYEYEIIGSCDEKPDYDVRDVVSTVAETFVGWGIHEGKVKMRVLHPNDGSFRYHYADLGRSLNLTHASKHAA
jgi:hypothetical protein